MKISEALLWGLHDIFSMVVIIYFIELVYKKRFNVTAYLYVKNQLEILVSYCITCMVFLYIYYFLENKFHIDDKYAEGIILVLFFLAAGVGGNHLYQTYFHKKTDKYNPTKEESLVIILTAFAAVGAKLVSEGIIGILVLCALFLGRLVWIDTRSIKDITDSVTGKHNRIIESSILFLAGMFMVSALMSVFNLPRIVQSFLAILYGVIILYPVEKMRPYLYKAIKRITRRKDSK